jgi:hypothetical protein
MIDEMMDLPTVVEKAPVADFRPESARADYPADRAGTPRRIKRNPNFAAAGE